MKNNFFVFFLIIFLFSKVTFAEQFIFETSKIEIIEDGKLIIATDGKAFSGDKNIEITATNFEYSKDLNLLKAYNGKAYIKSDNIIIEFTEIELDQVNSIITARGEVKINEITKNFIIETNLIIYDRISNIIKSPSQSIFTDKFNNIISTENFNYEMDKNILKIEKSNFKDFEGNSFKIDLAFINTLSNKLIGKDIELNLNNKSFNSNNEPRLKGKAVSYDNEVTEIDKGIFTTCKKTGKCPPWQLTAEKIKHDKKKQIINYKNAWLKIYDIPVVYFPKFFHPDPTVKRKSGFLIPSIKSSTASNNFLNLPYYHVISENKDLTFTPRLYDSDKILLQSEYRVANIDSNHISDISFFKEKNINSKSHFFYEFNNKINYLNFEEGNMSLKIQKTSNDTYLRANKLKSPLINSSEVLESSFDIDLFSDDFSINSELIVFENLNKDRTDRYEFILPRINLSKKIDNKTNLDGSFTFNSNNLIRNYQTNILEKTNINNLIFNSTPNITKNGFYNNYDLLFKNVNSDTSNSSSFKEGENYYLSGLFQFNSSLPLLKENENFQKILKPKISLKVSPDNTKDMKNDFVRMDVNNIYNLNRLSSSDTVEGGLSLTYGNDYSIFDKNKSRDILSLKLANNYRLSENEDLPKNNQLNQKTSNFFGEISYSPNEIFTTKYDTSVKNNFSDISYENFTTEININNFVTTFDYLNENNSADKNSYFVNSIKYSFDDSNNISFSTRENKETNLTEYYNLIYQYKNDCLSASIEYNKDYYSDRDIKPDENIFIKLTIIPFGETSSPNLKD
tara:strand:+ start:41 stop:2422 length:2382 start_codon:yes stop_codon:yes gene_type:complete